MPWMVNYDIPCDATVGGNSGDVGEGIGGTEIELFKWASELPAPTVITGVGLPTPLE